MKTSLLARLSFLLLFSTNLLSACSASYEPLFDTTGKEVTSFKNYYVVSVIRGAGGGGISYRRGINNFCPYDVVQESRDLQRGIPINFSPYDNSTIVRESTDLKLRFQSIIAYCRVVNPIWKVTNYDSSRGEWPIIASSGAGEGSPGAETLLNWFKLERVGDRENYDYKIVHCPSVCESCVKLCNNIGISREDGPRRLVLLPDDERALIVHLIPADTPVEERNQLILNH